ncbi:MAG: hypothetical protein ACJA0N_001749 [Pseudohongiellaceae bacterium]|jgi:hypothetical protein
MAVKASSNNSLIKFCDVGTALKILNSQSLRWSAPNLYNDPFELNHFSDTDFTAAQLLKGITHKAITILFGNAKASGNNELVTALKRWQHENRFETEQEAELVLKQLILPMAQQQQQDVNDYLARWRQYSKNIRVCCFADAPDNMRAWQRFANNHHGVALSFDKVEPSLKKAVAVSYADHPIAATSLKEQVDIAFGGGKPPCTDNFEMLLLHKPNSNREEQEWRCFDTEENESDQQLWYNAKPFQSKNLDALYLGLSIDPSDKRLITQLVAKDYPSCRIYQSEIANNSYNIRFTKI